MSNLTREQSIERLEKIIEELKQLPEAKRMAVLSWVIGELEHLMQDLKKPAPSKR